MEASSNGISEVEGCCSLVFLGLSLGSLFFPFGGFALFSGPVVALWMCSLELVSFASLGL